MDVNDGRAWAGSNDYPIGSDEPARLDNHSTNIFSVEHRTTNGPVVVSGGWLAAYGKAHGLVKLTRTSG